MAIRTGRFTITLPSRPVVQGFAAVAGKKEGEGPLAAEFDHIFDDTTLGEVSWEKAESKLHREAVIRALSKAQKSPADVDVIFAGDLLSQCIGTCFGIRELDMPFAGLYRDIVLSCERLARGEGKGRMWCTVHAKALPVQQFFKALRYRSLKPAEQETGTVPRNELVFEHTL